MRQTLVASCTFLTIALTNLMSGALLAQLPIGELTTLYPNGGQQGTTVTVTAGGANLDDGAALIFSHPGITAKVKQVAPVEFQKTGAKQYNQFDVSIAKNVPVGRYEARVVGRFGASSPRVFKVGSLPELLDDGSNKTPETAKATALNTVTNGRIDAATREYLKLSLKSNQRVILDCRAARIDSRLDGVLVLFDANNREVARSRRRLARDPLIDFRAPQDGEYTLMLYDFLYRGGIEYFYRLKIHTGAHVDFTMPLAAVPGSNVPYTIYGRNLPGGVDTNVKIDGDVLQKAIANMAAPPNAVDSVGAEALVSTSAASLDGFASAPFGVDPIRLGLAKTARIVVESEPNNKHETATTVKAPCEVHGQFYPRRDDDWIEFEAAKGQVFWIEVVSQRLGWETDPYITIHRVVKDAKGVVTLADVVQIDDPSDRKTKIGGNFDTSSDDPSARFATPETATYRLRVRDQFGASRDDPRYTYRLIIREQTPDFRLYALPQQTKVANANQVLSFSPVLRQGGSCLLRVDVARADGFTGQVDLRVEGLPEGVTCRETVLPAGANTAWLVLQAADSAKAAASAIRVVGKATINEKAVERTARPASIVWGTANKTLIRSEHRATQDLVVSVIAEKHQLEAKLGGDARIVTSKGGKISIPLNLARRGFAGDIKFVANNLPAELKPADVTIKGADSAGKLEWTLANAKAKPGVYSLHLRGDIKVKHVRNPDAIARAETAQKEVVASVAALAEEVKQKTAARDQAVKAMNEANAALKQAEQAMKTATAAEKKAMAEKTVGDAKKNSEAAAKANADAAKALADALAVQKRAAAAKTAVDKQVAAVKKANAAKDANITVVSSPVTIEVVASPIEMKVTPPTPLKQGAKGTFQIAFDRKFGFAEAMNVALTAPAAAKGLSVAKAAVAKDAKTAAIEVTAAADAKPGDHTVTVKVTATFNKVPVETVQTVVVRIEPK